MFRLNSFTKIKETSKKIYQRIYNRTYEQLEFDTNCGIYLGFIIGSGVGSYKVIEYYKGQISTPKILLNTVFVGIIGSLFGGSWGYLCGYIYPYGIVGLPSILISYNIYHKYNNMVQDKI